MNEEIVINELKRELVVTHTTTQVRLLKLIKTKKEAGLNAFALYNFYAVTASLQLTSQIKSTDTYCMTGLGWGKERFYKAKAILVKEGLIETIQKRDALGKLGDVYILVHYLRSTLRPTRTPVQPVSGSRVTNALEDNTKVLSNINALDKKEISPLNSSPPKKYSRLDDLTQEDFREIAEHYHVPVAFVLSKFEDVDNWASQPRNAKKIQGRDWRKTLMSWVKKDALQIIERSKGDPTKRAIDATNL